MDVYTRMIREVQRQFQSERVDGALDFVTKNANGKPLQSERKTKATGPGNATLPVAFLARSRIVVSETFENRLVFLWNQALPCLKTAK